MHTHAHTHDTDSEGIVDPSCSWTFGYLVQKFHEERRMDVVEVVIKLAQEPTSNAVATNNADKEERGEDTRWEKEYKIMFSRVFVFESHSTHMC